MTRPFAMSGAIASLAGFLYGGNLITFSSNPGDRFGPGQSLSLVVTAVFGGITSVAGAVLGSLWIVGVPRLLGRSYALFSSGFAVVNVMIPCPVLPAARSGHRLAASRSEERTRGGRGSAPPNRPARRATADQARA